MYFALLAEKFWFEVGFLLAFLQPTDQRLFVGAAGKMISVMQAISPP